MKPSRLEHWDRPLTLILLGFWLVVTIAVTLVSNGATRIYSWPWAFYLQSSLLAPWLWCAWRAARGARGLDVCWMVCLPLLGALMLSVGTSKHWHAALEAALVLATPLVLMPFVAEAWMRAGEHRRLVAINTLGVILGLACIEGLVFHFATAPDSDVFAWFLFQRNSYPLGHVNYTAGLALLALPVLGLLTIRTRGLRRAAWGSGFVLTGVYFVSAGSRAAAIGLLCQAAIAGGARARRHRWSGRAALAACGVAVAVAAILIAANPRLRQTLADPSATLHFGESERQRLGFLLTGMEILRAHPWTGIGPGTTPYHYPEHRTNLPGSLENSFQLHCAPLQWCVDTGAAGLLALIGSAGAFLAGLRRTRNPWSSEAVAAAMIMAGYGGFALSDHQLDTPVFPLVLAAAAGVLLAETRGAWTGGTPRPWVAAALGATAVAFAVLLIPSWQARAEFARAWDAKDADRPAEFLHHLRAAAQAAPWMPLYHNHLARSLAGVASQLPPDQARPLLEEARNAWRSSLEACPTQDHPWVNLGWLALLDRRPNDAGQCFSRATALEPNRTGAWLATALVQLERADTPAAVLALERELRVNPRFVTSPLWHNEPFEPLRAALLERLADVAISSTHDEPPPSSLTLTVFARWWWMDVVNPPELNAAGASPLTRLLGALPAIDDPKAMPPPGILPRELDQLRDIWRGASIDPRTPLPPGLIAAWSDHVANHRDDAFSVLLRTFPPTAIRHVQRSAAGILFRQTDGDVLTDLTEIPAHALDAFIPAPASEQLRRRTGQ